MVRLGDVDLDAKSLAALTFCSSLLFSLRAFGVRIGLFGGIGGGAPRGWTGLVPVVELVTGDDTFLITGETFWRIELEENTFSVVPEDENLATFEVTGTQ